MADKKEEPVSPISKEESATTREEMDFDNDEADDNKQQQHQQEKPPAAESTAKSPNPSPSPKPRVSFQEGPAEEIPPSKPPRPMSPMVQAENTLIEAFPSIDTKVVKAVLAASGGKVEPAFNALLGMTDPSFKPEEAAPPQPPRPQQRQQPMSQMEADEMYARQLAEQYNAGPRGGHRYNQREPGRRGPNQQRPRYDEDDREPSFFDDDLAEIGKNISQGFQDTQKKFNSWITSFRKKLDGEEDDDDDEDLYSGSGGPRPQQRRQNFGPSQTEQMHGIRRSAEQSRSARQSTEAQRYDADPQEFNADEFERLELRDDEAPPAMPPRTSSRPKSNPDLFKPQPKPPQSGPVDEVDAAERKTSAQGGDPEKAKKWQPLTSVAPHPEEDNDPFSLGDDDEEGDGKEGGVGKTADDKNEDLMKDASERLKKSASMSAGGSGQSGESGKQPGERKPSGSGNKDAIAEAILSGEGEGKKE
ncbi:hypothetical protein KC349_g7252 [Hortaea werneckii]|nr:hypothetical protein KC349_g7252 [Hortaea werneckii]